jgi:hypothetical protein
MLLALCRCASLLVQAVRWGAGAALDTPQPRRRQTSGL